jgi:acyl-CoA thioesterase FadM
MNGPLVRGRPSDRVFNKYDYRIRQCRTTYIALLKLHPRLREMIRHRITVHFEYCQKRNEREVLSTQGEQQNVCIHRDGERFLPTPIPASLAALLKLYAEA